MDIESIVKATDWHKKWMVVNFCLLDCSFLANYYHHECIKRFGVGFSHQFFVYKNNAVTTYLSITENSHYGQTVANIFIEKRSELDSMAGELLERTTAMRRLLTEPIDTFLSCEDFEQFERQYREYLPPYVGLIRSGDWLAGPIGDYALPILDRVRLQTETLYNETDTFIQGIAKRIAEKEDVPYDLKNCLTHIELKNYIQTGTLPEREMLEQRNTCTALYGDHGDSVFVSAADALQFEVSVTKMLGVTEGFARGQTAYPGVVKGTVRIIHNPSHAGQFQDGDVLLTSMTRPDFLPLMKKAGAVVTDAGGVLCHAAIVSREFKKPCIIGTQTATEAFQDGDMVEVDAGRGVVKKLS